MVPDGEVERPLAMDDWVVELSGHLLKKQGRKTTTDVAKIGNKLECMVSIGGPYGRDRCHRRDLSYMDFVRRLSLLFLLSSAGPPPQGFARKALGRRRCMMLKMVRFQPAIAS